MKNIDRLLKMAENFENKIAQTQPSIKKKESIRMLTWIISNSRVDYGKPEAKKFLEFLNSPKGKLMPTSHEIDKIAANLCFYRSAAGQPLVHSLLVSNLNTLLDTIKEYDYNFAPVDAENTVSRWEKAVETFKVRPQTYDNYPELKKALQTVVETEHLASRT